MSDKKDENTVNMDIYENLAFYDVSDDSEEKKYSKSLAHTIKSLEAHGIYFSDKEWEDIFGIKGEGDE